MSQSRVEALKNNLVVNSLINLLIRFYIAAFRVNGDLKLRFSWKRRIIMLRYLQKSRLKGSDRPPFKKASREFLMKNFGGYKDVSWSVCYSGLNGIYDHRYIPEDIYYDFVERKLNNFTLAQAYNDKNLYDRLFSNANLPATIFRIMNGRLYDKQYESTSLAQLQTLLAPYEHLVFKPAIDSGGGKNVLFDRPEAILQTVEALLAHGNPLQQNFIAQELIEQHEDLARFHPYSINTLRMMTLRLHNEIAAISTVLRMGRRQSRVDNEKSGGISVGIFPDGRLRGFAFDKYFNRLESHPDTGEIFAGKEIPRFSEAVALASRLHKSMPHFDLISWDIAIGKDKTHLIEMNLCYQGLNLHQVNNGPLFGENSEPLVASLKRFTNQ